MAPNRRAAVHPEAVVLHVSHGADGWTPLAEVRHSRDMNGIDVRVVRAAFGAAATLHDGYRDAVLTELRCQIFMTGPSAPADIEGLLIHGAQGIRSLTVVPLALS